MYSENDLLQIQAQQKKRWLVLSIPAVIFLAGVVVSLVFRMEWVTTLCTILLGVTIIAGYELFIRPLHCYEAHLKDALQGRNRTMEGGFLGMDEDISMVEGVKYRAMHVSDIDAEGEPCERLFYYDIEKPIPTFKTDTRVRVTYHDRSVSNLEVL